MNNDFEVGQTVRLPVGLRALPDHAASCVVLGGCIAAVEIGLRTEMQNEAKVVCLSGNDIGKIFEKGQIHDEDFVNRQAVRLPVSLISSAGSCC